MSLTSSPGELPMRVALEVIYKVAFDADGPVGGVEVLGTLDGIAQHVRLVVSHFKGFC